VRIVNAPEETGRMLGRIGGLGPTLRLQTLRMPKLRLPKLRLPKPGLIAAATLVAAAALPGIASAQSGVSVPQGSPIPRILPPAPPSVSPAAPTLVPPAPTTEVPNRPVNVTSVSVEGVTAYPQAEIAALAAGLIGPATPLPQIDAARLAILQRYRADGYVLSAVSINFNVANGQLRFIVTEGHIVSVKLDGDIGPAGTQVLRFLNRLTEKQPIDSTTLERYLLLAQDVPGVTLHAVLQPSADDPGALTLVAQVSRQAVSGLATVDNRAFVHTGPIEALGVVDFNSFSEYGEKTEAEFYHTFPNSENFGQASVETFLGSSGLKLKIYGGAGATVPTGSLALQDYVGTTTVFGAQLTYPMIRSRQQTLNLHLNFDGIESVVNLSSPPVQNSYDSLRVLRGSGDYALSDLLFGADRPGLNSVMARISQGLPILGATTNSNPDPPRIGEQTTFTKFDFQLSRTQTLFSPWQTATLALQGLLTGQYTRDVLPLSEEFYLGGMQYTRGYYSGQVTGDNALAATAELQLNTTLDLSAVKLPAEMSAQFYLFYDWGETWNNVSTDPNVHLSSTGGGVRAQVTPRVEVDLEGLARFNRFPTGTGVSPLYGGAFYWRVLVRY
jgi:hemolysin activation/secretion protein